MSRVRKQAAAVTLLLAVLAPGLPAAAQGQVTLTAVAGLGGRGRAGAWAPVSVTAENRGPALQGFIWVQGAAGGGHGAPVVLAEGARRQVEVLVPLGEEGLRAGVSLVAAGAPLAETTAQVEPVRADNLLALTLGADADGFRVLAGTRPDAATGLVVVPLEPAALPDHPLVLEGVDLVVLARTDTAVLRPAQRQALEAWVHRGGTLVLAGGPEWRRTLAGLPASLVPVQVTGTRTAPLGALGRWAGAPAPAADVIATGRLRAGTALAAEGADPLLALAPVGRGRVIYLAADPTLEPLAGAALAPVLWERILRLLPPPAGASLGPTGPAPRTPRGIPGLLERLPDLGLPALPAAAGLLAAYLLVAGPLAYWLLGKFDRREWLWAAVPLLALAATGTVWAAGSSRGRQGLAHSIALYEVLPGLPAALARNFVGVYNPAGPDVRAELAPGVLALPLPGAAGEARVTRADRTLVEFPGQEPWSIRALALDYLAPLAGPVEFDLTYRDGRVVGSVRNRTGQTFRDVLAFTWGGYMRVPALRAGETLAVDLPAGVVGGAPRGYLDAVATLPVRDPRQGHRRLVLETMLGAGREWDLGPFTFVAWPDEPPAFPAGLDRLGRTVQADALVVAHPLPRVDPEHPDIPPGHVRPRLLGSTGGAQVRGYGPLPSFRLQGGKLTLGFQLPPVNRDQVAEVRLLLNASGPAAAARAFRVRAWDWEAGEWLDLAATSDQALAGWRRLAGPSGELRVEVEASRVLELQFPTLALEGVDR